MAGGYHVKMQENRSELGQKLDINTKLRGTDDREYILLDPNPYNDP